MQLEVARRRRARRVQLEGARSRKPGGRGTVDAPCRPARELATIADLLATPEAQRFHESIDGERP